MRHLTVANYGTFLGISGERLVVREEGQIVKEIALSRLRTISVMKKGISLSSDLLLACAIRGIKVHFHDWRGKVSVALLAQNQHAVVALRKNQFAYLEDTQSRCTAAELVVAKLTNQRVILLYFNKYVCRRNAYFGEQLKKGAAQIDAIIKNIKNVNWEIEDSWRASLMGLEGMGARVYWENLILTQLTPPSFTKREGRGSLEVTNQALNFGYAILTSYVWSALDNAGLEVFAGIYHVDRPGKPSLVLDIIEEYRAWVVDRNVIKFRAQLEKESELTAELKKKLSEAIHETMASKVLYHKKRIRLDSLLQRQAYRLSGVFSGKKNYKGFHFKW